MTGELRPPDAETLAKFARVVGKRNMITDSDGQDAYLREPRGIFYRRAAAVVRPKTTAEVSRILAIAHKAATAIIPQSGNTGLVGGQTPSLRAPEGGEVILSLNRLNKLNPPNTQDDTIIAQAGVTLQQVREAAESAERLFPLHLASQGSCRIGGNLATNAGGISVLSYGSARDLCLGLEIVLPNGRVLNGLQRLRKDNAGYDLRNLLIGSEGTLAIITAACLKLFPRPTDSCVAWAGVRSPSAALALLALARRFGGRGLTAFELIQQFGVTLVTSHCSCRNPLAGDSPWYVLLALTDDSRRAPDRQADSGSGCNAIMADILAQGLEQGVVEDAVIASSPRQTDNLWRLREELSSAQKREGASIKHDISAPLDRIPRLIKQATAAVKHLLPGCRPLAFGHLGDGNIHFNISQPPGADAKAFLARWEESASVVNNIVIKLQGSVSAEHGIGQLKRQALLNAKIPIELDLMRGIKRSFDPRGILNPGKVLP